MNQGTLAEKKLGFRIHAMVFVPTIVLLVVVNLLIGASYWVQWVVLGPGARKAAS
jgi:hypothetical protein